VCQRLEPQGRRKAIGVHRRLPLHPRQWRALRLALDNADYPLFHVQQVVNPAVALRHDRLANGDTRSGEKIQVGAVLHVSAGVAELPVDQNPRPLLSLKANLVP
jgi:hypothetical protein